MKYTIVILAFFSLRSGFCDSATGPKESTVDSPLPVAHLGDTVRIKINESVRIDSTAYTLSFLDVPYDCRCPSDVACPWAGFASANFSISSASTDTVSLTFDIWGTIYWAQDIAIDTLGLRISMWYLDPYPRVADSASWQKSNYNALLKIKRSAAPG